jgi:hypothetical protein
MLLTIKNHMRLVKYFFVISIFAIMFNANAGLELVCKGAQPTSNHKTVYVDCQNRMAFIDMLGSAWREMEKCFDLPKWQRQRC